MSKPFQFKQFIISDFNSAMKVSTDGVLIGAWTDIENSNNILDVGTGSGLIAIMLAQRSDAKIDAIDIHKPSCEDAALNFSKCSWKDRLFLYNQSFFDFIKTCQKKYDLIVSNPPFYQNSLKSPIDSINISRHATSLTYEELIKGIKKILLPDGRLSLILPSSEYQYFKDIAIIEGLYCLKVCHVFPKPGKSILRVMMEFGLQRPDSIRLSELTIRNSVGEFSRDYQEITKDFYLQF